MVLFSSFFLFFPLFFPSRQRKISQGKASWRRRLPSTVGFPSGLSDLVSSLVISSSEGARNKERKTTEPFSSLRLPLKGTERCASLVRAGKSKCPCPAGRSRAGQQQPAGFGLSRGRQSFALDPQKQGQRARYLHVYPFKVKKKKKERKKRKNPAPFQVLTLSFVWSRNETDWAMAL